MSSSTTREPLAIRLQDVSKIYRLHGSQGDQLIDVLGLQRFGFRTKTAAKEFAALSNISLDVPRGHRIGIVGRNGAGKTTLLKLICGNFTPTHGEVEVNGAVQALMNVGLGFHPEYTGRENVEASLQYNGLSRTEYQQAIEGIIEFCELGDFLDQPFKTYSLGMQARLMFAAATAIRPDILIVDEVLGAGDAYFVTKSKTRVENLISSGCTMLLVSHSMQQVLELCDEAIWLENGKIRMKGDAFDVVKAYEEYIHGPIGQIANDAKPIQVSRSAEADLPRNRDSASPPITDKPPSRINVLTGLLQEPSFQPHQANDWSMAERTEPLGGFEFTTAGGVSRWAGEPSVKISGFSVSSESGVTNRLLSLCPAKISFLLCGEIAGEYKCRYGVAIHNLEGGCVARIFSPCDQFSIQEGECREVELLFNPLQLGPGEYIIGVSVSDYGGLEHINSARRLDLLSRSFCIFVELPDSLSGISASFFHSAEWGFGVGK